MPQRQLSSLSAATSLEPHTPNSSGTSSRGQRGGKPRRSPHASLKRRGRRPADKSAFQRDIEVRFTSGPWSVGCSWAWPPDERLPRNVCTGASQHRVIAACLTVMWSVLAAAVHAAGPGGGGSSTVLSCPLTATAATAATAPAATDPAAAPAAGRRRSGGCRQRCGAPDAATPVAHCAAGQLSGRPDTSTGGVFFHQWPLCC
jgi:hypothetical protein